MRDSLLAVWEDYTLNDSARFDAYYDYIWNKYLFSRPDSALLLADTLLYHSTKNKYKPGTAAGLNIKGVANGLMGRHDQALEYFRRAHNVYDGMGDRKGVAYMLKNMGNIYLRTDRYRQALEYFENSNHIYREINDDSGVAATLNSLGGIYYRQGDYNRALDYYQRSLRLLQKIEVANELGNVLNNIGNIYETQQDYRKAIEYFQQSMKIMREIGDNFAIATLYNNMGVLLKQLGEYERGLEYHENSLKIMREINNGAGIAQSLHNIGIIYKERGEFEKALSYLRMSLGKSDSSGFRRGALNSLVALGSMRLEMDAADQALSDCGQGLNVAKEIGAIQFQRDALNCLYLASKRIGRTGEALYYHEMMREVEDSIAADETSRRLQQMEFHRQMQADSLQQEEERLKLEMAHREEVRRKNRIRDISLGTGILILLVSGGLWNRLRYVRRSREQISRERDKSDHLLLNILPLEVAHELKERGKVAARKYEDVTILFTDFKDFTRTSAELEASELVDEIHYCFRHFDGICENYCIEKIKTIGDAYMAAGGLPVPEKDSARRTVLAGLEMSDFIKKRKRDREKAGKSGFEMRVGIHTGPVVAGIVGEKKFQYDLWGDAVNTASRMESNGLAGRVNISEETRKRIVDDTEFSFESRPEQEVKGKGKMKMYFVQRTKNV